MCLEIIVLSMHVGITLYDDNKTSNFARVSICRQILCISVVVGVAPARPLT